VAVQSVQRVTGPVDEPHPRLVALGGKRGRHRPTAGSRPWSVATAAKQFARTVAMSSLSSVNSPNRS
jgi:hypothetical protein